VKTTLLCLAGAVLLACLPGLAGACEKPGGATLTLEPIAANAERLLREKNFKALDALAARYRKPDAMASDGRPLLSGFYDGLTVVQDGCAATRDTTVFERRRALLLQWAGATRDRGAPGIALAMLDQSQAWGARGGGYASTVS
jgi:hypothetical protein